MAKQNKNNYLWIGIAVVTVVILAIILISNSNNDSQENISFNKNLLKTEIEKISLSTSYIPKISSLTFHDNLLFIEYSSFENDNNRIFNEQQKVSEKIRFYFQENNLKEPAEVLFRVNSITNEHIEFYSIFETRISWDELINMANLELVYSSWADRVNSTKKLK